MFLLTWLILFKFRGNWFNIHHARVINLIPYKGAFDGSIYIGMKEILYNILVFVPFGVYISMLIQKEKLPLKVIPCFLLSLFFEVTQFIFAIGATDISDILDNTLGGVCGILLFVIIQKLMPKKYALVINIIGIVIEVIGFSLIALMFFDRWVYRVYFI